MVSVLGNGNIYILVIVRIWTGLVIVEIKFKYRIIVWFSFMSNVYIFEGF